MPAANIDTPVRCEECDRPWGDPRERWQSDWVDDTDDLHVWCPTCWLA